MSLQFSLPGTIVVLTAVRLGFNLPRSQARERCGRCTHPFQIPTCTGTADPNLIHAVPAPGFLGSGGFGHNNLVLIIQSINIFHVSLLNQATDPIVSITGALFPTASPRASSFCRSSASRCCEKIVRHSRSRQSKHLPAKTRHTFFFSICSLSVK